MLWNQEPKATFITLYGKSKNIFAITYRFFLQFFRRSEKAFNQLELTWAAVLGRLRATVAANLADNMDILWFFRLNRTKIQNSVFPLAENLAGMGCKWVFDSQGSQFIILGWELCGSNFCAKVKESF